MMRDRPNDEVMGKAVRQFGIHHTRHHFVSDFTVTLKINFCDVTESFSGSRDNGPPCKNKARGKGLF